MKLSLSLAALLLLPAAKAQQPTALSTDSVGPTRFLAVHGRKSVIMGNQQEGLEIWGYPFQILSNYEIGFTPSGATTEVDARKVLRRIEYQPDSVTRIYIGPDYLVREKLFVPLDQPGAVLTYEVEGSRPLAIQVHFQPVLNLMWPAALGGQYTRWVPPSAATNIPGFQISEPGRNFSAMIGSSEIVSHDDIVNSTIRNESFVSFSLHPSGQPASPATATVLITLNPPGTMNPGDLLHTLSQNLPNLETEARKHYETLATNSLRIHTPDEIVNQSLAWAAVALDQAWVCNTMLGCGSVAGYGPSRDARRPQYAWFFAGDGLVATNALISSGQYTRAREELAFIERYQHPTTGMIWHELSQSAGFIDWSKYPYMYVHVDISFDYLATLARYVTVSGDKAYARDHWASIAAAYRYCQSLISSNDHLPHIPEDKEAGDEQHRPADDLGLSASWIDAAESFAVLARLTDHTPQVDPALLEARQARQSIPPYYWDSARNFWLDSHNAKGEGLYRHAAGPTQLTVQHVFTPLQDETILNQLTSADFQADWGTREVAASATDYNPYSYGAGSISALGSTAIATTFWKAHRPESAASLWSAILQWNSLDSLGHIHEVLAGNFYQEQTESVPEQTWSSAGLLDGTVRGMLGLVIDGTQNRIDFTPHIPPEWPSVTVENVRLQDATITLSLKHDAANVDLDISNQGAATTLWFHPQIPLGAHLLGAYFRNHKLEAKVEQFAGDEHAVVRLDVPSGESHCHLAFNGGVALILQKHAFRIGDSSSNIKMVNIRLRGKVLSVEADVNFAGDSSFTLRTPWEITSSPGVKVLRIGSGQYEVTFLRPAGTPAAVLSYTREHTELTFSAQLN